MTATVYDIEADRGGTITVTVQVVEANGTASNLTGYTGSMQARLNADDASAVMTGTVAITAATGLVVGAFLASATAIVDWNAAVYDLRIVNGTAIEYLVRGAIRLTPTVTR